VRRVTTMGIEASSSSGSLVSLAEEEGHSRPSVTTRTRSPRRSLHDKGYVYARG
jgi:hypothetical protein